MEKSENTDQSFELDGTVLSNFTVAQAVINPEPIPGADDPTVSGVKDLQRTVNWRLLMKRLYQRKSFFYYNSNKQKR